MARKVERGVRAVERAWQRTLARLAVAGDPYEDGFKPLKDEQRRARRKAVALGHNLGRWHTRKHAPTGAADAYCATCHAGAHINLDLPCRSYGTAVTDRCTGGTA